jgi:transposase
MYILFLVSGNAHTILKQCGIAGTDVEEIKLEEKAIASFSRVRSLLRQRPYKGIIWGCRDLRFQRFQSLMKMYMLLSGKQGFIADEQGGRNNYSMVSFFFKDIPLVMFEIAFALGVIGFSYIRLPFLRRNLLRNDK